jgi:hypothetical protein
MKGYENFYQKNHLTFLSMARKVIARATQIDKEELNVPLSTQKTKIGA